MDVQYGACYESFDAEAYYPKSGVDKSQYQYKVTLSTGLFRTLTIGYLKTKSDAEKWSKNCKQAWIEMHNNSHKAKEASRKKECEKNKKPFNPKKCPAFNIKTKIVKI